MAKLPRVRLPRFFQLRIPQSVKEIHDWQSALTAAVTVPEPLVAKIVRNAIARNPGQPPAVIIADLNKRYRRRMSVESGGVGLGAAYPGIGTALAAGLSIAELGSFISESTLYVLAVARLYGIEVSDVERRKALVLSSLFGADANQIMTEELGFTSLAWARASLQTLKSEQLKSVNRYLTRKLSKRALQKETSNYLGRLLPFGVGAAIGWFSGKALAQQVISGLAVSLGEPPLQLPPQLVTIDVTQADPQFIDISSASEEN